MFFIVRYLELVKNKYIVHYIIFIKLILFQKYLHLLVVRYRKNTKLVIKLTNLVFFDFLENKKW